MQASKRSNRAVSRWAGGAAALVTVAAALLTPTGALASGAAAAQDVYRYAGECMVLRETRSGRYVGSALFGYALRASKDRAAPVRMQATALGRYLLYGPRGFMPAAGRDDRVVPSRLAGPAADWQFEAAHGGLVLRNLESGQALSMDRGGRLTQHSHSKAVWALEPAEGCETFPEVSVDVTGPPPGESPGPVRGFLDAHTHVTAFEFLGGRFHCGRPFSPYGVADAMTDCPDHEPDGRFAIAENLLSSGSLTGTHDTTGWPTFKDWPRGDSLTHEGTYWKGIERAWRGGLRIMVAHLVENRALCELYWLKKNACEDMASMALQARALHELQDYIDAQFKGPGKGFFRIVTSPQQARAVIGEGKLAVVIGVETSQPFDCLLKDGVAQCSEAQIDEGLQTLWDLGVRSLFPIHKFDNAFGGVAMDGGSTGVLVNLGNRYLTGRWWEVDECPGDESDRTPPSIAPEGADPQVAMTTLGLYVSGFDRALMAPMNDPDSLPTYPPGPVCNVRGLTDLGEYLIHRMIDRGMIIESDHLSARARARVLDILESRGYAGVISSHSWGGLPSARRIQQLGGFVAPYANRSTTFVREWRDLRSTQPPGTLFGIGYGTDTNGLGAQAAPRPDAPVNDPVVYPFPAVIGPGTIEQSRWGERVWDFNLDGAANYGLFVDWVQDNGNVGGDQVVEDLANGAEAYLQMWERATGR